MKPHRLIWLAFAVVVGACGAPIPGPTLITPAQPLTPTKPKIASVVPTMASMAVPTATSGKSVRAILVRDAGGRLIALPVDPESLADLPDYAPMDLQHHYADAISPDGRLWAVITYPYSTSNSGGILHLIDLNTWANIPTPLKFNEYIQQMRFSPDGLRLAVAWDWDKASGGVDHWGAAITIINPGAPEEVETIELNLLPRRLQFSLDGQQIVLYATPWPVRGDTALLASGAPQVTAFDVSTGKTLWSLTLEEVKDGAYREPTADDPSLVNSYTPGIVFSADGHWLYVVHPDEDRLTVVNIKAGTANVLPITEPHSWLDRLISLTAGTAYAKGALGGAVKWAVLSPNGKRLYISGIQRRFQKDVDEPGGFRVIESPVNPQVIDPESGERLMQLETALAGASPIGVVLSPDGRWLYLTYEQTQGNTPDLPGLEVFDAATLKPVAQFAEGATYAQLAFAPSSARAYLTWLSDTSSGTISHLGVLDTPTHQLIATRDVAGWVGTLILPPR